MHLVVVGCELGFNTAATVECEDDMPVYDVSPDRDVVLPLERLLL
jgi:hypothetical protein